MEYAYECEDGDRIVVTQDPSGSMRCGIGSTVWDCALVLCKYLEKHPEQVKDKVVLDLSAGVGLAGLVALKLGAKAVFWSEDDQDSQILSLLRSNVPPESASSVFPLRWGNQPQMDALLSASRGFDLILASDLVCWPEFTSALSSTLSYMGATTLLCFERRSTCPTDLYSDLLSRLAYSTIPQKDMHPNYVSSEIELVLVHTK
jgi:predicted nicotinamide N-methyase